MTFLTPIALFGLILLPILVLLHLRRRSRVEEVSSLLIWREVLSDTTRGGKRLVLLSLPLLLLQMLAVTAIVFGLARASSAGSPLTPQVFVLDNSSRMTASDLLPNRLAAAKRAIEERIASTPAGTRISIVVATAQPYLLIVTTNHDQAGHALDAVPPNIAPVDLPAALRLANGLAGRAPKHGTAIVLVYPLGESLPPIVAPAGLLASLVIGRSTDNQAISQFTARCTAGAACEVYAAIRNEAGQAVREPITIEGDGTPLAQQTLNLPAGSETGLSFTVPGNRHVLELVLARADLLPRDNVAWQVLPRNIDLHVSLIGDAARTAPLQRALAAVPGIVVRVLVPSKYTPTATRNNDLLLFDGTLPPGPLPESPTLLLIDPPRLPGGSITGTLADATVSGMDRASSLLTDVDLTSLDVPPSSARALTLPSGLQPVVWAANGPLLAAGTMDGRRVAILAFDPRRGNLTQLAAFPVLLHNIVQWSADWLPATATLGSEITLDTPPATTMIGITHTGTTGTTPLLTVQPVAGHASVFIATQPGVYTVTERGAWGARTSSVAANTEQSILLASLVALPTAATSSLTAGTPLSWWPLLGLLACLLIVAEWAYVAVRREG